MLPVIKTPEFFTTIPSSGQEIKYRPYLVNEQKILYMAFQSEEEEHIMNALLNVLKDCILTEIKFDDLTNFDIEWLFLKTRIKSVGEIVELKMKHLEPSVCKHITDVTVDLEKISIDTNKKLNNKLILQNNIGVCLKYSKFSEMKHLKDKKNDADRAFSVIAASIDYIFEGDNKYNEFTEDEISEWVGNLNQEQFEKIVECIKDTPRLEYVLEWKCEECGETEKIELRGLMNFFT